MKMQDALVVPAPGDQQDHHIGAIVTKLDLTSALQCLDVVKPRFGADLSRAAAVEAHIPGSQVATTAEDGLAPPRRARADQRAEPLDQAELAGITYGRAARIRLQAQVQSKDGGVHGQVSDRPRDRARRLRTGHDRSAKASGLGDMLLAQPG